MARKPAIVSLFDNYGYAVRQTDPEKSHQNSSGEVRNRYTGEEVSYLMKGNQVTLRI